MKTLNTHGVYDHSDAQDQKAMFKARLLTFIVMIVALSVLVLTALYLNKLNDQDKRIEYIESGHSEIK